MEIYKDEAGELYVKMSGRTEDWEILFSQKMPRTTLEPMRVDPDGKFVFKLKMCPEENCSFCGSEQEWSEEEIGVIIGNIFNKR